ncbi:hypothetical protein GCM10011428_24680 [Streptomyces violaceus]
MLTSHQVVGTVGEDHLRGHRQTTAAPVLGTGDPAQIFVQARDVPPLSVQESLRPLRFGPLLIGLLAAGLVLLGRHRRILVQPRHLGADARVPACPGLLVRRRRPCREGRQRAQQDRNEQATATV